MKKKLLALFLALTMAVSLLTPALAVEGGLVDSITNLIESSAGKEKLLQAKNILISLGEDLKEEIDEATVNLFQKTELVVNDLEIPGVDFQWQIKVPDLDLWVDIYDQTEGGVDLSYAMIANMLDDDGQAKVRCEISLGKFAVQSPEITVEVDDVTEPEPTPVEEQDPVVLEGPKVEINDDDDRDETEKPVVPQEPAEPELPAEPESPAEPEAPAESGTSEEDVIDHRGLENIATAFTRRTANLSASTRNGIVVANTDQKYNVVINYVFENNEIVADPYTANLAAGSSFSATVTFPVVQGYLPYVNETQQNSIVLNYTAISQDDTINVVYKPTNVDYTVIHYKQNVDDDHYTEAERETKQGLTASTVPDVAKTYEGFYALLYEKPTIAADGSTVVEVYYDRYYYLMNFDLDGGYGVEPIYARYGTDLGDVGTPTRAGYNFQGWTLKSSSARVPDTMPAENQTYKAVWQPEGTAKVTVVFWGENADDEEYSYIKSAAVNVKPGTEFTYSESGSLVCGQDSHTHDASCGYACGQEEHTHGSDCYTLTCMQEVHTHSKSCYTCGQVEHTNHTTDCYEGVGKKQDVYTGLPDNPVNGQVVNHWYYKNLIYINGTWYKYTGSISAGNIAPTICGKTEHTHTDACLGCGKTEHTHSDYTGSCYTLNCTTPEHTHSNDCGYNCGKTAHTHNSSCYMSGAGLDSNLWKFVKSDTVTVAADGSSVVNVYYDRTTFTLTFKDGDTTVYTLTEKWGADISKHWPIKGTNGTTYNNGERWSPSGSKTYTQVLVHLNIMPAESFTLTVSRKNFDTFIMHYMVETLPGETGTTYNGKTFKQSFEVKANYNYVTQKEDFFDLDGFTQWASNPSFKNGQIDIDGGGNVYFYYTRNSYTLTFNDKYTDVKTESVKYEATLSAYSNYVPEVPSAYEPGSVVFGGWYLNPEGTGAEYKLNEHTMPADNVLLYAKWVPTTHKVEFYLDKAALDAGTKLRTHPDITVPHGSMATPTPADPTNGSYTFVGWFYMENGVEKAFDFDNMPVNKDLKVYGKWSSNVLKQYTIYYKIQGTDTQIAAPTIGSGLAGVTKTFEAKGGTDLYADYQECYFPVIKSHSLTLDIDDVSKNTFTFWYVQKEAVPYTVKYLNKETGEAVADEKTVSDNRKAVVTETFAPVSGMMPDAYQKRLVVSAEEGAINEIIFYYTEDTTHAYYKITHYTENLATDAQGNTTWTEYASSQAVGNIGDLYTAKPMTIPGFTYNSEVEGTVASGKLIANGLELKLYYTRNSYPYQVRYLEKVTGNQLHDPKYGSGKYGEVVSESAIEIANYTAVDSNAQTLNIRIEESQTEAKLNIIYFYYKEKEATINYQVVGPDGCGTVSPTSETLKVLSDTAQGSTASANQGFRFVGWYTDAACTTPVDSSWVSDGKMTPAKAENTPWTTTTYYAKFEYDRANLTITKSCDSSWDNTQSFLFTVTGPDGFSMDVTVQGNGSVTIKDLPIGNYTVTEQKNWSWRYTANSEKQEITLSPTGTNTVEFTNTLSNSQWLSGTARAVNNWALEFGNN
ncbi:MAG: InlB B-repeat-containing protein [Bacillota bacterium]|nr:InlB B-repeat-containing protein [Bacillota bacterium]